MHELRLGVRSVQDSFVPEIMTSICNVIKFTADTNISPECQGFVYDSEQKIAFFKPQPQTRLLDSSNLCSNPTTYTWLRSEKRGWLHCTNTCINLPGYRCLCRTVEHAWHSQHGMCLDQFSCGTVRPASIMTANMARAFDGLEEYHGLLCRCMPAESCSNAHAYALCVYTGLAGAPSTTSGSDGSSGWTTCHSCMLPCAKYALGPNVSSC